MKILVTGSNGQLGNELLEISGEYREFEFIYTDEKELDITNETHLDDFFEVHRPDVVINCAAFTAVDRAESEENIAFLINSTAVSYLSKVSTKYGVLLVQISTDYVFDGKASIPYVETNETNPISAYGRSKYGGEIAVHQFAANAVIIRTSWLYSQFGNNFVKTITKYSKERGLLNIVYDQIGTPTYARDLARTILKIIPLVVMSSGVEVFHYSNEGVASWYDFAKAVVDYSGIECKINPISSKDYIQAAPRPFYSVLDKTKLKERFCIEIPYWRDSLKECTELLSE